MATIEAPWTQQRDALLRANEVRSFRASVKVGLKSGGLSLAELLEQPPALLDGMRVIELLMATPRLGRVRVNAALSRLQVSSTRRVGELTDRQRRELLVVLGVAS